MSILQIWVTWTSKITLKNLQLCSIKIKWSHAPCDVTCSRSILNLVLPSWRMHRIGLLEMKAFRKQDQLATLQVHLPEGGWGMLIVCVIWLCDITDDSALVILTDAGSRNKEKKKQEVSLIKLWNSVHKYYKNHICYCVDLLAPFPVSHTYSFSHCMRWMLGVWVTRNQTM